MVFRNANNFMVYQKEVHRNVRRHMGSWKHYIVYIESGTIEYHTPDGKLTFEAGSFFYIPMGMIYAKNRIDCIEHSIGFTFFPEAELTPFAPQLLPRKFLQKFLAIPKNGFPNSNAMCQLYSLLNEIAPNMQTGSHQRTNSTNLIATIYYYIKNNKNITIDDIAAYCGMSVPTLYRTLKNNYGKTPNQIKQECQIELACITLTKTDYSIQEISNRLYFCNPNYFSRVFKQIKGVTPSQYRKNEKERKRHPPR